MGPMCCLLDDKCIINIPFLYSLRVGCSFDGLVFKLSHEQVGHNSIDGGANGCSRYLFIILTLEEEICAFWGRFSNNVVICCMEMDVLLCYSESCSNLCFSNGDGWVFLVQRWIRFFTSWGMMNFPSSGLMFLTCSTKSCVFLMWWEKVLPMVWGC